MGMNEMKIAFNFLLLSNFSIEGHLRPLLASVPDICVHSKASVSL